MKKKIIVFLIILIIIAVVDFILVKSTSSPNKIENENFQHTEEPILGNYAMDQAVTEFLLSLIDAREGGSGFCVFENLYPEKELFPIYVWARCGEFKAVSAELKEYSGFSIPIKIDYPNELSYYDQSRFSYEIPRDGSYYSQDIKEIFPEEIWPALNFDVTDLNEKIERIASRSVGTE
jgi:hypothetical protein